MSRTNPAMRVVLAVCWFVMAFLVQPWAADANPSGQNECTRAVHSWISACADAEHLDLGAVECFPDRVIVDVKGDVGLRVDISQDGERAFRKAGAAGLSPMGEFANWRTEPEGRRHAFDALAECVSRDATFLDAPAIAIPDKPHVLPGDRSAKGLDMRSLGDAWKVVFGLIFVSVGFAAGVMWQRRRRVVDAASSTPPAAKRHAVPVMVFLGTLVLVEVWAIHAADTDFMMPDPFHWLAAGVTILFVVAWFLKWPQVRRGMMAFCIGLPLSILVVEWRLSAASVDEPRIVKSTDPILRYTYRPGFPIDQSEGERIVVTNDGLWDVPRVQPKPAGVTRVVVLGDSVPNDPSIPFRRRFPRQLEALLAERAQSGQTIEVVNVSCEGYNTVQEVRLLETVGLRYEPDVVVIAYVLNDPFLQNGGYRRIGNSYFAFHLTTLFERRSCALFGEMHSNYAFDLVVRESFAHLRLLADAHHFKVLVAPLPVLEPFDDPGCLAVYDKVVSVAKEHGFSAGRVVDAFQGTDHRSFLKPHARLDITHPNAEGHDRMARRLAELVTPLVFGKADP